MTEKETVVIMGRSWETINSMQQGMYQNPVISHDEQQPTESDFGLLETYGVGGLQKMEYYGVLDRLNRLNLTHNKSSKEVK